MHHDQQRHHAYERPVTLARHDGPHGEIVLRRHGPHHEIIANGCFLMDTSDGRSERHLVNTAARATPVRATLLL
ncbi:hypothetical protein ACFVIM_04960, partial [Streptomyces sp. NPDC057638]